MEYTKDYLKFANAYIKELTKLVGDEFESKEELEGVVNTPLVIDDTLTSLDCGPIYRLKGNAMNKDFCIYLCEESEKSTVVAVVVGPCGTYLNEMVKNIIKGAVI